MREITKDLLEERTFHSIYDPKSGEKPDQDDDNEAEKLRSFMTVNISDLTEIPEDDEVSRERR